MREDNGANENHNHDKEFHSGIEVHQETAHSQNLYLIGPLSDKSANKDPAYPVPNK